MNYKGWCVSPWMNTIASCNQFEPIRIGENLVVNCNSTSRSELSNPSSQTLRKRQLRSARHFATEGTLLRYSLSITERYGEIRNFTTVTTFLAPSLTPGYAWWVSKAEIVLDLVRLDTKWPTHDWQNDAKAIFVLKGLETKLQRIYPKIDVGYMQRK